MMKHAWLILQAQCDVVFTATAATLGGHEGLSYVPGSTLLGWAAARLYPRSVEHNGFDAYTAFHSGKLRFGDGWPLTHSGAPAFPIPQCWRERKRARGGIALSSESDWRRPLPAFRIGEVLNFQFGERFRDKEGDSEQAEALKNAFVAADGTAHRPVRGWRGKTAVTPGDRRAAAGQFFGYDHIRSGSSFASLLEADDEPRAAAAFDAILGLFKEAEKKGETLKLGRSANSEFGGDFRLCIDERPNVPWDNDRAILDSCPTDQAGRLIVSIWCLSDLAIEDPSTGAPVVRPTATALGLRAGTFDVHRSFIATRRYAPFNKKLGRRDIDRAVIAGGSVFAFAIDGDTDPNELRAIAHEGIGLYREGGLGRVWVNPALLRKSQPQFGDSLSFERPAVRPYDAAQLEIWVNTGRDIAVWVQDQWQAASVRRGAEGLATDWKRSLDQLLATLRALNREIPTAAQWASVAEACGRHRRRPEQELRRALTAICGKSAWLEIAPGADPASTQAWIEARLSEPLPTDVSRADAFTLLANAAQKQATDGG
jgi:CRISPR-associated protein Csx10